MTIWDAFKRGGFGGRAGVGKPASGGFAPKDPTASGTSYVIVPAATTRLETTNADSPTISDSWSILVTMRWQTLPGGDYGSHPTGYITWGDYSVYPRCGVAIGNAAWGGMHCQNGAQYTGDSDGSAPSTVNFQTRLMVYDASLWTGTDTRGAYRGYTDGSANTMSAFLNNTNVTTCSPSALLRLGTDDRTTSVDEVMEVAIWNSALSASDCTTVTGGGEISTVPDNAHYLCNEGSGNDIADEVNGYTLSSSNSNLTWSTIA